MIKFFIGIGVGALLGLMANGAHASTIVSPASGIDGKFSVTNDASFKLYAPSADGIDYKSFYCTASSTPLDDDCDVSESHLGGKWIVQDLATDTPSDLAYYDYQISTTTASQLYNGMVLLGGQAITDSVPFMEGVAGILVVLFACGLIIAGFTGGFDRMRGRRLR